MERDAQTFDTCVEYDKKKHSTRTDYWVSQGRKFCEFCKCSIADNKPSIQFHENGKKHKENVAKRLTEMQKKATKEAKEAVDFEREMQKMEAAALKAYMNDVKSNADFTSQLIQSGVSSLPEPEVIEPGPKSLSPSKKPQKKVPVVRKWMEAITEAGVTYYWNIDTGESVWERPADGYLSLADQEKQKSHQSTKNDGNKPKKHKKPGKIHLNKNKQPKPVQPKEEEKPVTTDFRPASLSHPYGTWQKVEIKKEEPVDLQLPEQEFIKISVPKIREESEKKFKEKVTTPGFASSKEGETGFKKRKFASECKRNMRRRQDDE